MNKHLISLWLVAAFSAAHCAELGLAQGGSGGAPGIMLDFTSSEPQGLRIHRWHVDTLSSVPLPIVQLWHRQGTYVGHEFSSKGWTLHDEKEVIRGQLGEFNTLIPFDPLDIPNGETYGIYLVVSNHHPHTPFVSGLEASTIPPALPTYTGTGLRVDGGTGRQSISLTPGNPFGPPAFPGFMLVGQIGYAPVPEPATALTLLAGIGALVARRRHSRSR